MYVSKARKVPLKAFLGAFEWLSIPHGLKKEANSAQITIRVVPKIARELFHKPVFKISDLPELVEDANASILNWPGFLDRIRSLTLNCNVGGRIKPCTVGGEAIKETLASARARQGVNSADVASHLWRSIFHDNVLVRPVLTQPAKCARPENSVLLSATAMAHIQGAQLLREAFGQVYARAVRNGAASSNVSTPPAPPQQGIMSKRHKALVIETPVMNGERGLLSELAQLFSPSMNPFTETKEEFVKHVVAQVKSNLLSNLKNLAISAATPERTAFTNLTEEAISSSEAFTSAFTSIIYDRLLDPFQGRGTINPYGLSSIVKERLVGSITSSAMQFVTKSPTRRTYADQLSLQQFITDRWIGTMPEPINKGGTGSLANSRDQEPLEFHDLLGKIVFHPWLLEILNLAFSITVPLEDLDGGATSIAVDEVQFDFEKADKIRPGIVSTVEVDKDTFFPRELNPSSNHYKGCMLLNKPGMDANALPEFLLEQLDVDYAAEKCILAANTLKTQADSSTDVKDHSTKLGTLPTTGISLLMLRRPRPIDDPQCVVVGPDRVNLRYFAEHLVIGYRPDISTLRQNVDRTSCAEDWKTIVGRKVHRIRTAGCDLTKHFDRLPVDECFVSPIGRAITDKENPSNKTLLNFEELFRWRGWSMGAPPVECHRRTLSELFTPEDVSMDGLSIDYRSSGKLPKQRIGWGYRLGMRLVYADGKSISLDDAKLVYAENSCCILGARHISDRNPAPLQGNEYLPFFRNEPVLAPSAHLTHELADERLPGETLQSLVVATADHVKPWPPSTDRVLVPPRIDLELAIRLGMYDDLSLQEVPPKSAFPGIYLNKYGAFPSNPSPILDKLSLGKDVPSDKTYTYFVPSRLASPPQVPYLPDPWARRLIIGFYRAVDNHLLGVDFFDHYDEAHKWPNCKQLTVRLQSTLQERLTGYRHNKNRLCAGYATQWEGDTLVILLPPGHSLKVLCWYEMDHLALSQSGIVDCMAQYLCSDDADDCRTALNCPKAASSSIKDSRYWLIRCLSGWQDRFPHEIFESVRSCHGPASLNLMSLECLNPFMELSLTHAVSIPVGELRCSDAQPVAHVPKQNNFYEGVVRDAPAIDSTIENRFDLQRDKPGDKVAVFHGDIKFDRLSTTRIECYASWKSIDDRACEPVEGTGSDVLKLDNIVGALSNPHLVSENPSHKTELPIDNDLLLLSRVRTQIGRKTNEDNRTIADGDRVIGTPRIVEFPDTKAYFVKFHLESFSRFLNLFSEEFKSERRVSDVICERWVKSSEPPHPPAVAYIVPIYPWDRQCERDNVLHRRKGGWFRIWLERPWFSSGEGELLALVCWPPETFDPSHTSYDYSVSADKRRWGALWEKMKGVGPTPPKAIRGLVTAWGSDPIWEEIISGGSPCLNYMPPSAFPNRLNETTIAVVPSQYARVNGGEENLRVGLALYKPERDKEACRWYVDVNINIVAPHSYTPFVRLALARYQPNSLPGCEISQIVHSEFVQLTPERNATVTLLERSGLSRKIKVTVSGVAAKQAINSTEKEGRRQNQMILRLDARRKGFFEPDNYRAMDMQAYAATHFSAQYAWTPLQDSRGKERFEMCYSSADEGWSQVIEFNLRPHHMHSVYLEELEPTTQDPDPFLEGPQSLRMDRRIVYCDRLPMPSLE